MLPRQEQEEEMTSVNLFTIKGTLPQHDSWYVEEDVKVGAASKRLHVVLDVEESFKSTWILVLKQSEDIYMMYTLIWKYK